MASEKKAAGYIRAYEGKTGDRDIQAALIKRCAEANELNLQVIYTDMGFHKNRNAADRARAKQLGITAPKRYIKCFPEWEEMLIAAAKGEIGTIIVDRRERLYRNLQEKALLENVVKRRGIQIIEAGTVELPHKELKRNAAVYHYFVPNTRREGVRTTNLVKDLGCFYEKIASHHNWNFCGMYIDESVFCRTEIERLLERTDVDVIVCKFFYHINRKLLKFLKIVREMNMRGITLVSTEEGVIRCDYEETVALNGVCRIAIYDRDRSDAERTTHAITKKRLNRFCQQVAPDVSVLDLYEEDGKKPADAFEKLVQNAKNYDLIILDTFGKLGETVNEMMECMRKLRIPIYSLKEGGLHIDEQERHI